MVKIFKKLRKLRDAFNKILDDASLTKEEHEALVASDEFDYKGDTMLSNLSMAFAPMSIPVYTDKDGKELSIAEAKQEAQKLIARNNKTADRPGQSIL